MSVLKFSDVTVVRDGRKVLDSVVFSTDLFRVAVIGCNGSGKSTFVRLLNGLVLPSFGQVSVDGYDTKTAGKRLRRRVGFVFSNPDSQLVMPQVYEDLLFGLKSLGVAKDSVEVRICGVLEKLGILGLKNRQIYTLSGGEKQLVALAAVLVMEPEIIVFDEPTTLLDLRNKLLFRQLLGQLSQQVVLVTHDLDLVFEYEQVVVLDKGKVVFVGQANVAVDFYRNLCC